MSWEAGCTGSLWETRCEIAHPRPRVPAFTGPPLSVAEHRPQGLPASRVLWACGAVATTPGTPVARTAVLEGVFPLVAQGPAIFASLLGLAKKELRKIQSNSRDPRSQVGADSRKESQRPVPLLNPGLRFPSTVFSNSVIICLSQQSSRAQGKGFSSVGLECWQQWGERGGPVAGLASLGCREPGPCDGDAVGAGHSCSGGQGGGSGTPWVRPGPLPFPALCLSWSLAVQGALGACIWGEAQGGVPCGLGCWEGLLPAPLNPCGVLGAFLTWVGCTGALGNALPDL